MLCISASDAAKNHHSVQELSGALIQGREEIPQDTLHQLTGSMPKHCQFVVGSACEFSFFTLIFSVILNPALNGSMILVSTDRHFADFQ